MLIGELTIYIGGTSAHWRSRFADRDMLMRYLGDAPGHAMLRGIISLEDVAREILDASEMERFLAARLDNMGGENTVEVESESDENEEEEVEEVDPLAVVEESDEEFEFDELDDFPLGDEENAVDQSDGDDGF